MLMISYNKSTFIYIFNFFRHFYSNPFSSHSFIHIITFLI